MPGENNMTAALLVAGVILGAMGGSGVLWAWLAAEWLQGKDPLPVEPREPVRWHPAVLAVTFVWLGINILSQLAGAFLVAKEPLPDDASKSISLAGVWSTIILSVTVFLVLLLALWGQSPRRSLADYGITLRGFGRQTLVGVGGLLAAVLPVVAALLAMIPFRSVETQHALLKLLREQPGWQTVGPIFLAAVIVAPLLEELVFRVILQGWLTERWSARPAIVVTVLVFAFVHGWRDAIPLIPLAVILGVVYHRTHRYWASVVVHALFNLTMLSLSLLAPRP